MDLFDKDKRSWIMGRIRSKNTKPEIIVRSILHRMGFRFSLKNKKLPGSPDVVMPRHKTIVFVHGCFWHRHSKCKMASVPKTRVMFWREKFENNLRRDKKNQCELRKLGWSVIVIWECQVLRSPETVAKRLHGIITRLSPAWQTGYPGFVEGGSMKNVKTKNCKIVSYVIPGKKELLKIAEKRADYTRMSLSATPG